MQLLVCKLALLLVVVFLLLSQCFTPALSKHDRHLELSKVNSTVDEEYIDQCRRQPWAVLKDNTSCECGDNIDGIVRCDHDQNGALSTLMLPCFCMTYSDIYNRTLVGHCIYTCEFLQSSQYFNVEPLKGNESEYFGSGCIRNNRKLVRRTGQNCGNCLPGYAPALYTYNTSCVECSDYKYNWLKYLVIAYLPLTFFYLFVVLFRIKLTSGVFNAYILASQLISAPVQMRLLSISTSQYTEQSFPFKVMSSVYSLWNLDIFYNVYTPFCLNPNTTTLQIFALEYAVATYPLLLIFLTFVFVHLHDKYTVIIRLWSPFYKVFALIRREWDIRSSLVDVFVVFLLLSYVKIANISIDIITPVYFYDINGTRMPSLYLYYNGSMEYFGPDHKPYAILALIMFSLFNILPLLLLCLYPSRCFHKCLNFIHFHSNTLHIFVDTYQGCFKTTPYDCRYFAAIYLGFRLLNLILFSLTTSPFFYALAGVLTMFMALLVAIVRPYENQAYVIIDVVFLTFLSLVSLGVPAFGFARYTDPKHLDKRWYLVEYPVFALPPIYGIVVLSYNFLIPKKAVLKLKECAKYCKRRMHNNYEQLEEDYPPLSHFGLPAVTYNYEQE